MGEAWAGRVDIWPVMRGAEVAVGRGIGRVGGPGAGTAGRGRRGRGVTRVAVRAGKVEAVEWGGHGRAAERGGGGPFGSSCMQADGADVAWARAAVVADRSRPPPMIIRRRCVVRRIGEAYGVR